MLAEAIHSVADTGNQGLLFLGGKRSRKAPTAEHPFGFGTERYFWAFVVAARAVHARLAVRPLRGHREAHPSPRARVADLGVRRARRRDRARGLVAAHRASRGDADRARAAPGGGSSARPRAPSCRWCCSRTPARSSACSSRSSGVSLAEITGNPRWDALGSIGIGLLLGVIAVVLAIEMKSLLIGEAASPQVDEQIRDRDPRRPRGVADHPPPHPAPRPRRRARRRQARVHGSPSRCARTPAC